ncbi:thiamine phosphate synthase [Humitalea sp. 24SJ18S-53]|uniref:thiamine phosphate synthase n=1 Tax=Humitalea sp. 24SJ18S-53 TaxID=3422307 RepID=UPI003D66C555
MWLVGDAQRLPDLRAAAARLPGPRGAAGVLARDQAPGVMVGLARLCRARGRVLLVAGDGRAALRLRAGLHVPDRRAAAGLLPFLLARRGGAPWARLTVAVHGRAGLARGRRLRADAGLVSPAFPTLSHPGAAALGPHRWARLAGSCRRGLPGVIALGGVAPATAGRLPGWANGLAAIGALVAIRQ